MSISDFDLNLSDGSLRLRGQNTESRDTLSEASGSQRSLRDQLIEDFYWYLLHSTAAHAFPEGIYEKRREAWNDTLPHVTGACNYAILLRHMLVHGEGKEPHLLKSVPDWWLHEGESIRIERLPTHFGEMALTVVGLADDGICGMTQETRTRRRLTTPPLAPDLSRSTAGAAATKRVGWMPTGSRTIRDPKTGSENQEIEATHAFVNRRNRLGHRHDGRGGERDDEGHSGWDFASRSTAGRPEAGCRSKTG